MPQKTYYLRNCEPSNRDHAHVDVSADAQTVDSEPSEMNTIHSLNLLQQEEVASFLPFGNDLLTNYNDFDDIKSVTSELTVPEAELVRLTKSLALHISTTDFAHHANKLTSIKLDFRRFKVSVARSKRSSCDGSNSNNPPPPASETSDLSHDIPFSPSSHHPHGDNSTAVPPLTNAVSFSSTTFELNMPLSNNLQTNPFGITQSLDTSAHVNAIGLASISTTNVLHDNTYTVPPQHRLTVPKIQPSVFQGNPLAWLDWFALFSATIDTLPRKDHPLANSCLWRTKSNISGYGCIPAMYQHALSRLNSIYGKPDRIVMSFPQRLQTFRQPSTDDLNSFTNYANFISFVDNFTQLHFLHDIHSTVNLTCALSKLPADVRLNWNRHVLWQNIKDPSLRNFAPSLQNFATACRDTFIPFSDTYHNGRSSSSTKARAQGHNSKTPLVKPSSQSSSCPEKKGCFYLGSCEHFKAFSIFSNRPQKLRNEVPIVLQLSEGL